MAGRTVRVSLFREGVFIGDADLRGSSIRVGRDWRADISDPQSGHRRMVLVSRGIRGTRLHLPGNAAATFRRKGSILTLQDMVAWGLVKGRESGFTVLLSPDVSAEFTIGGASYRLQYVPSARAPVQASTEVSGSVPWRFRVGMPDFADVIFTVLLLLVFLAHTAGVRYLGDYPIPEVTLKQLPRRISRIILEPIRPPQAVQAPKVPSVEADTQQRSPAEQEAPEKKEAPPEPEVKPAVPAPAPDAGPESLRSQVSKVGVLGVLSGRGTAGRSSQSKGISALLLDSDLERSLDEVLSEVEGITLPGRGVDGGSGTGLPESDGRGLIDIDGIIGDRQVGAPMKVTSIGDGTQEGLGTEAGRKVIALKPEEREERSTRAISRIISAHTGAIRYAYNRELRKNPALRGKIVLSFTISPSGEVTECRVEETEMKWPPLENSLVRMAKGWRFPAIPEGTVTVTYPLVFFPSM